MFDRKVKLSLLVFVVVALALVFLVASKGNSLSLAVNQISFSPNGKMVIWQTGEQRDNGITTTYLSNLQTGKNYRLSTHIGEFGAWLPNGFGFLADVVGTSDMLDIGGYGISINCLVQIRYSPEDVSLGNGHEGLATTRCGDAAPGQGNIVSASPLGMKSFDGNPRYFVARDVSLGITPHETVSLYGPQKSPFLGFGRISRLESDYPTLPGQFSWSPNGKQVASFTRKLPSQSKQLPFSTIYVRSVNGSAKKFNLNKKIVTSLGPWINNNTLTLITLGIEKNQSQPSATTTVLSLDTNTGLTRELPCRITFLVKNCSDAHAQFTRFIPIGYQSAGHTVVMRAAPIQNRKEIKWIYTTEGKTWKELTAYDSLVALSPDGRYIAYSHPHLHLPITVLDLKTNQQQTISP